jgi:hypothetical protein
MGLRQITIAAFAFVCLLLFFSTTQAEDADDPRHIAVSLRMIGHQVLLSAHDSSSRVLPIEKVKDRYRIPFESEFEFDPEELVTTINRVVKEAGMSHAYIVEVEKCETGEIVYSYEMGYVEKANMIPCKARVQPKACYSLLFTLREPTAAMHAPEASDGSSVGTNQLPYPIVVILFMLTGGGIFVLWKRRHRSMIDPDLIPLGEFQFDKRNTALLIEDQRIELSSKESDLLLLLYQAVNTTVEREFILNRVWGDEGNYVGRTLDVFISKLRKKLEADPNLKIVNIRGVGYKLVMET